jgi:hypothetical protein
MPADKTVPHRRESSTTSHRTTKQAQKQPENQSQRPENPSRKAREFSRGVLRRVVERVVDPEAQKQYCVLSCGHRVTRSSGQNSDRCYCSECDPAAGAMERKRKKKLRLGPIVGGSRKR